MIIELSYQRSGELSTGFLRVGEDKEDFIDIEFIVMMKRLARAIRGTPENGDLMLKVLDRVLIIRTDREGLAPYTLDKETVELFRNDPAAAIRRMTFPQGVVVSLKDDLKSKSLESAPLPVGYDIIAISFGENISCRVQDGKIECPVCGRFAYSTKPLEFKCSMCGAPLIKSEVSEKWVSFKVQDLLSLNAPRYFLPRIHNDGRLWVTREELQERYSAYLTEKETACSSTRV